MNLSIGFLVLVVASRLLKFRSRQGGSAGPPAAGRDPGRGVDREPEGRHFQHGAIQSHGSEPGGVAGQRETGAKNKLKHNI